MATLHISAVAAGIVVTVADELVEQNVGYLPWVLGENLAGQVDAFVNEKGLGYYPALDFFRAEGAEVVDPALLSLIDEVAFFCVSYARREVRRRLSRAFSSVSIEQAQCTAYTMPHVRPQRANAPANLARHLSPNSIKMELVLNSIQKTPLENVEQFSVEKVNRWISGAFASVQVLGSRAMGTAANR